MWTPVVEQLGARVTSVAIDLPGHGSRRDERFDLEAAVASVEEHLAARPVVCGLSLGGYVAILAADRWPDSIAGLVLSGASASYRGFGGLSTRGFGYVLPLLAPLLEKKNRESIVRIAGPEVAADMARAGMSLSSAARALRQVPGPDYHGMVVSYPGPVLLLNGERDDANLSEAADLVDRRPDLRTVTLEDAGHACALSQPAAFVGALLQFVGAL